MVTIERVPPNSEQLLLLGIEDSTCKEQFDLLRIGEHYLLLKCLLLLVVSNLLFGLLDVAYQVVSCLLHLFLYFVSISV